MFQCSTNIVDKNKCKFEPVAVYFIYQTFTCVSFCFYDVTLGDERLVKFYLYVLQRMGSGQMMLL